MSDNSWMQYIPKWAYTFLATVVAIVLIAILFGGTVITPLGPISLTFSEEHRVPSLDTISGTSWKSRTDSGPFNVECVYRAKLSGMADVEVAYIYPNWVEAGELRFSYGSLANFIIRARDKQNAIKQERRNEIARFNSVVLENCS